MRWRYRDATVTVTITGVNDEPSHKTTSNGGDAVIEERQRDIWAIPRQQGMCSPTIPTLIQRRPVPSLVSRPQPRPDPSQEASEAPSWGPTARSFSPRMGPGSIRSTTRTGTHRTWHRAKWSRTFCYTITDCAGATSTATMVITITWV